MQDTANVFDDPDQDQLAAELDVKVQTLKNWRSAGKGPPWYRAGNKTRYPRTGLREWKESLTVYPSPAPALTVKRGPGRPRKHPVAA